MDATSRASDDSFETVRFSNLTERENLRKTFPKTRTREPPRVVELPRGLFDTLQFARTDCASETSLWEKRRRSEETFEEEEVVVPRDDNDDSRALERDRREIAAAVEAYDVWSPFSEKFFPKTSFTDPTGGSRRVVCGKTRRRTFAIRAASSISEREAIVRRSNDACVRSVTYVTDESLALRLRDFASSNLEARLSLRDLVKSQRLDEISGLDDVSSRDDETIEEDVTIARDDALFKTSQRVGARSSENSTYRNVAFDSTISAELADERKGLARRDVGLLRSSDLSNDLAEKSENDAIALALAGSLSLSSSAASHRRVSENFAADERSNFGKTRARVTVRRVLAGGDDERPDANYSETIVSDVSKFSEISQDQFSQNREASRKRPRDSSEDDEVDSENQPRKRVRADADTTVEDRVDFSETVGQNFESLGSSSTFQKTSDEQVSKVADVFERSDERNDERRAEIPSRRRYRSILERVLLSSEYRRARTRRAMRYDDFFVRLRTLISRMNDDDSRESIELFRGINDQYFRSLMDLSRAAFAWFDEVATNARNFLVRTIVPTCSPNRRFDDTLFECTYDWLLKRSLDEFARASFFRAYEYVRSFELHASEVRNIDSWRKTSTNAETNAETNATVPQCEIPQLKRLNAALKELLTFATRPPNSRIIDAIVVSFSGSAENSESVALESASGRVRTTLAAIRDALRSLDLCRELIENVVTYRALSIGFPRETARCAEEDPSSALTRRRLLATVASSSRLASVAWRVFRYNVSSKNANAFPDKSTASEFFEKDGAFALPTPIWNLSLDSFARNDYFADRSNGLRKHRRGTFESDDAITDCLRAVQRDEYFALYEESSAFDRDLIRNDARFYTTVFDRLRDDIALVANETQRPL